MKQVSDTTGEHEESDLEFKAQSITAWICFGRIRSIILPVVISLFSFFFFRFIFFFFPPPFFFRFGLYGVERDNDGYMIERILPKHIHAVTALGFELKIALFVLACSIGYLFSSNLG